MHALDVVVDQAARRADWVNLMLSLVREKQFTEWIFRGERWLHPSHAQADMRSVCGGL